ncbi:MAG TPA: cytochrome c [Myxococcaceae bacterium]|nr:cytochrome c [Myxococcaceae bacterium]
MTPARLAIAWAAAAAALATSGCAFEDTGLMTQQPKYQAYGPSPLFPDGRAMRQPPAGTVAWEYRDLKPEMKRYRTGALANGSPSSDMTTYVQANPMPVTRQLLDTGRNRYNVYCAVCHGLTGDGSSIVAENMGSRPPPNLIPYANRPPGYIYAVITEGFGYMNPYSSYLSVEERWAVTAYLSVLQRSQSVPVASAPPEWRTKAAAASGDALPHQEAAP